MAVFARSQRNYEEERRRGEEKTYDIRQGIEISELMHPKLTLIPHNLVPPTIFSLNSTLPVSKLSTAPGPLANRSWISFPGNPGRPG